MEKYYSCPEIAEHFGVTIGTVWSWIRGKRLPAIRISKSYRIRPEDLKKFEEERKTA